MPALWPLMFQSRSSRVREDPQQEMNQSIGRSIPAEMVSVSRPLLYQLTVVKIIFSETGSINQWLYVFTSL